MGILVVAVDHGYNLEGVLAVAVADSSLVVAVFDAPDSIVHLKTGRVVVTLTTYFRSYRSNRFGHLCLGKVGMVRNSCLLLLGRYQILTGGLSSYA